MCEEGRISEEMGLIIVCEFFLFMFKFVWKVLWVNKVGVGVCLIYKWFDEMEVGIDMYCCVDVLVSYWIWEGFFMSCLNCVWCLFFCCRVRSLLVSGSYMIWVSCYVVFL